MGRCGIPTMTCLLLLLSMAALYASAQRSRSEMTSDEFPNGLPRISGNVNNRGRQGRIADGTRVNRRRQNRRGRPGRQRSARIPRVEGVSRREMNLARKLHNASSVFGSRLLTTAFGPQVRYNTVLSPYSVHTVLAMTSLGARRGTQREMLGTLGLPQAGLRRRMIHRAYKALIRLLSQETEAAVLRTANAVFVRPNIPLEYSFRQGLTENYNATFESFSFGAPGGPEALINQWVSDATRGMIPVLLGPGTISQNTAMVLLNAVHFKTTFKKEFDESLTAPRDFTILSGEVRQLTTMSVEGSFRYVNHHNTEVVELLYTGEQHALYVLIPNEDSSVDALLNQLQDTDTFGINPVDTMLDGLRPSTMTFSMPKFSIDSGSLSLKDHLKRMGIQRAFDARADFSGISTSPLSIEDVIHKTVIEVSEEGTEAAAATAVIMLRASSGTLPLIVAANRPFVFIIRDTQLKTVLFLGTFTGESQS